MFKNFTIGKKIFFSFSIVIIMYFIGSVFNLISLHNNQEALKKSSELTKPSVEALKQLRVMNIYCRMLITNWVYIEQSSNSIEEKEDLVELHQIQYPELKKKLVSLSKQDWSQKDALKLDSVFLQYDSFLARQQSIMQSLETFDDYEDPVKKFEAEVEIDSIIIQYAQIQNDLNHLIDGKVIEDTKYDNQLFSSFVNLERYILIFLVISSVISIASAYYTSKSIADPLIGLKENINVLSRGEIPSESMESSRTDEVGEMASAINLLTKNVKMTAKFAEKIGQGKFDAFHVPLGPKDLMGNSLLTMRKNLEDFAKEERDRSWATQGQAIIGDILNKYSTEYEVLLNHILSALVDRLSSNYGVLYIVEIDSNGVEYLKLSSTFACNNSKFLQNEIYLGDGLISESWEHRKVFHLTNIPAEYFQIESGLGQSIPKQTLIFPLRVNDNVVGVIELATLTEFKKMHLDFIDKVSGNIAISITNIRINELAKRTLDKSKTILDQGPIDQIKIKETALSLEDKEIFEYLESTYPYIITSSDYKIVSVSDSVVDTLKYKQEELIQSRLSKIFSLDSYQVLKDSFDKEQTFRSTLSLHTKQMKQFQAIVSAKKVKIKANYLYYFTFLDVSELKDLAKK